MFYSRRYYELDDLDMLDLRFISSINDLSVAESIVSDIPSFVSVSVTLLINTNGNYIADVNKYIMRHVG